jgi:hypothetical protein
MRATADLIRATAKDGQHAKATAEAIIKLPAVVRHRRTLPDHVENALTKLEFR